MIANGSAVLAGTLAWSVPLMILILYLTKLLVTSRRYTACQRPLLSEYVHDCLGSCSALFSRVPNAMI